MICPGCNTKGVEHAYSRTESPPCAAWPRCPRCGNATDPVANYRKSRTTEIMGELGVCFICALHEETARDYVSGKRRNLLIIDAYTYSADAGNSVALGAPDPRPGTPMRGMAGRRFDIERFDGSPPFSCYSLWAGGPVDEFCRDRMPDTARFLGGAGRSQVGETTCFNPSPARGEQS